MKKIILRSLLVLALLAPGISKAQYNIPNGSFENWSTSGQLMKWTVVQGTPVRLSTIDYTVTTNGVSQSLGRAAKDGSWFIEMPMVDATHPCIIGQSFPISARPSCFTMNYAYFPDATADQFEVGILFTKWDNNLMKRDTILLGVVAPAAGFAEPWTTLLNGDLTGAYNSKYPGINPDTASIVVYTSTQASNGHTTLLIDQMRFTDTLVTAGVKLPDEQAFQPTGISAYPNPFSTTTTIHYNLTESGMLNLSVYDMNGKEVANLVNGNQAAGIYDQIFNANGLNNGVYIYKLQTASGVQTGKLILNR